MRFSLFPLQFILACQRQGNSRDYPLRVEDEWLSCLGRRIEADVWWMMYPMYFIHLYRVAETSIETFNFHRKHDFSLHSIMGGYVETLKVPKILRKREISSFLLGKTPSFLGQRDVSRTNRQIRSLSLASSSFTVIYCNKFVLLAASRFLIMSHGSEGYFDWSHEVRCSLHSRDAAFVLSSPLLAVSMRNCRLIEITALEKNESILCN